MRICGNDHKTASTAEGLRCATSAGTSLTFVFAAVQASLFMIHTENPAACSGH